MSVSARAPLRHTSEGTTLGSEGRNKGDTTGRGGGVEKEEEEKEEGRERGKTLR